MTDLISRETAIELIENRQRKLCPVGMFSRNAVYGSDREKFDCWQEIIDEIERLPSVNAAQVVHGQWQEVHTTARGYGKVWYQHYCTPLLYESPYYYCPHCGAKMDEKQEE